MDITAVEDWSNRNVVQLILFLWSLILANQDKNK